MIPNQFEFEIRVIAKSRYAIVLRNQSAIILDQNPVLAENMKILEPSNPSVGSIITKGSGRTETIGNTSLLYLTSARDKLLNEQAFVIESDENGQSVFKRMTTEEVKSISLVDDELPCIFKVKEQSDERIVAAAVLIPGVADYHGTIYTAETSRAAAYYFMENYMTDNTHGINIMHKGVLIENAIRVIQSYVTDQKMTFKVEAVAATKTHPSRKRKSVTYPVGSWLMWARILNDAIWGDIKNGKFTGWSPEGLGKVKPIEAA